MAIISGGTGNNHIFGTDAGEIIFGDPYTLNAYAFGEYGGTGSDLTSGRGGNDRIAGAGGIDWLVGDAGVISGTGRGGNDQLFGGDGDDFLYGDSDNGMSGHARGGNDLLLGGAGDDQLLGDSFTMSDDTRGGNDVLIGGAGNDFMAGDTFSRMSGNAHGGNDTLIGSFTKNTLPPPEQLDAENACVTDGVPITGQHVTAMNCPSALIHMLIPPIRAYASWRCARNPWSSTRCWPHWRTVPAAG